MTSFDQRPKLRKQSSCRLSLGSVRWHDPSGSKSKWLDSELFVAIDLSLFSLSSLHLWLGMSPHIDASAFSEDPDLSARNRPASLLERQFIVELARRMPARSLIAWLIDEPHDIRGKIFRLEFPFRGALHRRITLATTAPF